MQDPKRRKGKIIRTSKHHIQRPWICRWR